jgi:hypothetical protein
MKAANSNRAPKSRPFLVPGLLVFVLAMFFWRSFLPGYVHFSNDGPLGQQNAAWLQLPGAFTGMWDDLNDIGFSAGTFSPGVSGILKWMLGPVGYAKFYAPIALFILGLGAWAFFRQLKLSPLAVALGALAATLNSTFFATACWGVASQQIAIGMNFFALALMMSNSPETPKLTRWTRLALAGLCVGVNVMEAADIGAIFSIFIAAYAFLKALTDEGGSIFSKCARGVGSVAVIAVFAGFIATQTVVALVGSQIQGIAGTGQDAETKAAHWDFATQWSEPKKETLGLFVPGLFGYKLDTPKDMMPFLQDTYKGGNYWGGVGRDPAIDRFFDSGQTGNPPQGFMRFTGGGNYCGIFVVLIAFWVIAQSLRRRNSVFAENQRCYIWFWAVVLVGSLLLAWGRFAPFYKIVYALPYFSTIRNPTKFLIIFSWAIVILFGYGIHALSRRYLEVAAGNSSSFSSQLKNWWTKVGGFDRNWTLACAAGVSASLLGWLIYASERPSLVHYLQTVGFGDEGMAGEIAAFSIGQVGRFILLFALAAGLCILVLARVFAGKRARLGGLLLGLLLVFDLGRADLPYVIHWDYTQKYSSNPIIDFLRDKPYEQRVAALPFQAQQHLPSYDDYFGDLYRIEWTQHHFLYYNIQSLDIIQMARMPTDLLAYTEALAYRDTPDTIHLVTRRWELTNTRYLLGPAGFLDVMNQQLDPAQHRFRIAQRFDVQPKPGIEQMSQLEELTAVPNDDGSLALFEFTGALPRAKLYSAWQVNTNDTDVLKTLADANFDPAKKILISTPQKDLPAAATNENSGTVEFKSYTPKDIVFAANATAPSVLLLNDKFDPQWSVTVDGKPAELLRCNFIMRGVFLPPGAHTVEFQFSLPNKPLFVTLAAVGVGILLCGFLFFFGTP